ncbi:MAG: hypothetical protein AAFY02_01805 [Pseudomonadota bacterium]
MGLFEPHERHRGCHGETPLTTAAAAEPGGLPGREPAFDESAGPAFPPGPLLRVESSGDIARIAACARALDRPAVVVSSGAVGWHLFAAMIHAGEAEGAPLAFLFDAGTRAGPATEALRSGALWVLCEATPAQSLALEGLARTLGAGFLAEAPRAVLDCPDLPTLKQALQQPQ